MQDLNGNTRHKSLGALYGSRGEPPRTIDFDALNGTGHSASTRHYRFNIRRVRIEKICLYSLFVEKNINAT